MYVLEGIEVFKLRKDSQGTKNGWVGGKALLMKDLDLEKTGEVGS